MEANGVADTDLVRTLLETDTGTPSSGGVTDDSEEDESAYADDAADTAAEDAASEEGAGV